MFTHGSELPQILASIEADPSLGQPLSPRSPILEAEVIHAVRAEMAQKLADIVFRRTELATAGPLDELALEACADLMAGELGWDEAARQQALSETRAAYLAAGGRILETAGAA